MTKLLKNYWACPIPQEATHFAIINGDLVTYGPEHSSAIFYLPKGSWTFIATTKDISPEQATEIVDAFWSHQYMVYKDYTKQRGRIGFLNPLESFKSIFSQKELVEGNYAILKKDVK